MGTQEFVVLVITLCSIQKTLADNMDGDSIEKRTPGWGKRDVAPRVGYLESVLSDLSRYELNGANDDTMNLALDKRRPGWGKRSFTDDFELDKRKPGWGKRAYSIDMNSALEAAVKRTPGWGKRSLESNLLEEVNGEDERVKRRPGWGKRNEDHNYGVSKRRPGWGKRAPGWGKRSDPGNCQRLIKEIRNLRAKLEVVSSYVLIWFMQIISFICFQNPST